MLFLFLIIVLDSLPKDIFCPLRYSGTWTQNFLLPPANSILSTNLIIHLWQFSKLKTILHSDKKKVLVYCSPKTGYSARLLLKWIYSLMCPFTHCIQIFPITTLCCYCFISIICLHNKQQIFIKKFFFAALKHEKLVKM